MFGINRNAIKDNTIAELKMDKERLEHIIQGQRRTLNRALCPLDGLKQQGYAEGLAEGIQRGRQQAEFARASAPLHEHDFAALEARILANMMAADIGQSWLYRGYTRGQWRSAFGALQNLPKPQPQAKHLPVYRYFRSAAGNFRWRFRVGSSLLERAQLQAGPVAHWEPSAKTVGQILADDRFISLGDTPKWHG